MQGESEGTRAWIRVAAPVLVLIVAVFAARAILGSRPEPEVRLPAVEAAPRVEATRLAATSYRPLIRARGTVRPTRRNALVSEIAGAVTSLSDDFVVGGRFEQGDTLVRIDERDSAIALTRARANLARAEAQFEEQAALAEQAVLEWRQLGRSGEPSSLTLREPQLAAARAERDAAAAELERAELDLERTRIVAPYDGLVLERAVDTGQFVARGTLLGRVHASDALEVAVPLGARQLARLALPDGSSSRGASGVPATASAEVIADGAGRERRWPGASAAGRARWCGSSASSRSPSNSTSSSASTIRSPRPARRFGSISRSRSSSRGGRSRRSSSCRARRSARATRWC